MAKKETKVIISAQTSKYEKSMRDVQRVSKKTSQSITAAWKTASIAVVAATAAMGIGFKIAIDAASDLQEVQGKFDVVFAAHKEQAEDMAKVLVDSYAMSTREAKQYMSSIQDLLVPMGMTSDKALLMSHEVVKLSADLGSFNNLPTAQVMLDIQSALVGNFETMKKYGVVLNETVIKQKALEMGLWSGKGMVDANTKAQIAYKLMLEGSAAAIGDQERTMGSYANQVKLLKAQTEDISAVIGNKLLPEVTSWVNQLNEMIKNHPELIDQMGEYAKSVLDAATAMGKLVGWIMGFKKYPTLLEDFQSHVKEIRQEIVYLQKVTEGKLFTFKGDKERLIGLQTELAHTLKMIEKIKMTRDGLKDSRLEEALIDPDKYFDALPDTTIIASSVYEQTEEMKARYIEYYAALEEMADNADMREIMRERERLKELEPFIAARLALKEAESQELLALDEELEDEQMRIARELSGYYKKLDKDKYGDMKNAMAGWANSFSSTLNDMLWGAEVTFESILESFMQMITQMMIQKYIIETMFTGGGWGWIGSLLEAVGGIAGGGKVPEGIGPVTFAAQGAAFSQGISGYSNKVVSTPTLFAFAGGSGLMGEAGPEAIMPLTRTSGGDLGVKAEIRPTSQPTDGGNTTIVIIANDAKSFDDMVKRNPASIVSVVNDALEEHTGFRDTMRGTL